MPKWDRELAKAILSILGRAKLEAVAPTGLIDFTGDGGWLRRLS